MAQLSASAEIRTRLDHPVIDADGHTVEYEPALVDYLKQVGGVKLAERYVKMRTEGGTSVWYRLSPEERHHKRFTRPPWWAIPTRNTLDRATAMLPKLLRERLDETGIDFTVLYPTLGLSLIRLDDDELRPAVCRALNTMNADIFREQSNRMTPAATIPMHTPAEAISELEYAIGELGLKAIMIAGHVRRPIPEVAQKAPEVARHAYWIDNLALDSAYDYDPVWAKCVELKVAPTAHSGSMGWGSRTSVSNYMFNHIGHFATAGEAFCKALFMGGVTRRFPTLKFGFLECGAGWACNLYADMVGHWEKRNREAIENYNPAHLDRDQLRELFTQYGDVVAAGRLDRLGDHAGLLSQPPEDPAQLDDWAACGIERPEDIRELFVPNFYFGCEADDPMNAWAFNDKVNPFGARLKAMLSSDIGHWDVPDIREVLAEAYELVAKQVITQDDFRDFVFTNPATLYSGMNPDFFTGTIVEGAVQQLRAQTT